MLVLLPSMWLTCSLFSGFSINVKATIRCNLYVTLSTLTTLYPPYPALLPKLHKPKLSNFSPFLLVIVKRT